MTNEALQDILLYNRRTCRIEKEDVFGRKWMDLFYGRAMGRRITGRVLCRRRISRLYGRFQSLSGSRKNIAPFVRQHHIDLQQAIVPPQGFRSFNDFFIRRLKTDARPVEQDPRRFISPADSRLQIFVIENDFSLKVKGLEMTLPGLLGRTVPEKDYRGGLCLVFRLAPCDYHRFGYIDDGVQEPIHSMGGLFHSVSPLALRHKPDILATNYRQWCLIQTTRWGTLIQIEVGAMMVGSIVQNKPGGGPCRRGEEKGYFQFGGSTVVVIVEPGRLSMDADIQACSEKHIETLVKYGEPVGSAL